MLNIIYDTSIDDVKSFKVIFFYLMFYSHDYHNVKYFQSI